MAKQEEFHEPKGHPLFLWGLIALAVVLVLFGIWYLYGALNGVHGVQVDGPAIQSVMLPDPEPLQPPKPDPEPKEQPKEQVETPSPSPQEAPKQDAPAPMTQNAPAQAGSDSYGMQSGSGGGMGAPGKAGNCIGPNCGDSGGPAAGGVSDTFYARSLASALQQRVQSDKRVNREIFQADFAVWIGPDGRVTRAEIVKGSRDDRRDQLLRDLILNATGLTPPPATFKFPRRISVTGKRAI